MTELTLIAPGSRAKIGDIEVLVTCVYIEVGQIDYNVAWWREGQRHNERVPEYEITEADKTMKVRFEWLNTRDQNSIFGIVTSTSFAAP